MSGNPVGYLVGRESIDFPTDQELVSDKLISAQRLDGQRIEGRRFEHCTFANVSFKDVVVGNTVFLDCAFVGCYFRKTRIRDCQFVGSKFFDCDFPKVQVHSSDFRYAQFSACAIPHEELEHSLPSEPNLKEMLASELAVSAEEIGMSATAREYRLEAITAKEAHLTAAVLGASSWYEEHYPGLRRVKALLRLTGSKLNGLAWGHGERWGVLLRNLAALAIVVFPAILWFIRDSLGPAGEAPVGPGEVLWLSISTIFPGGAETALEPVGWVAQVALTLESIVGLVLSGLLVTMLLRSVLIR